MTLHSVFISHAHDDAPAAASLCHALEALGTKCWIAPRDVAPGDPWAGQISAAIHGSKLMLVLVTSPANESEHVAREITLANDAKVPILPVIADRSVVLSQELAYRLAGIQRLEAPPPVDSAWPRIARVVNDLLARTPASILVPEGIDAGKESKRRLVFLYKRGANPDEKLLVQLQAKLEERGYATFIDRHLEIGVKWASELSARICDADGVVILLSELAVHSDMLLEEVRLALKQFQQAGKPRLLPVRVCFTGSLPGELGSLLDRLQYFPWRGDQDTGLLIDALENALHRPALTFNLPSPGGAMPFDAQAYVARPTDDDFMAAFGSEPIVAVRGARQMGKTSLFARGIHELCRQGTHVVLTDLQKLNASDFQSVERFYTVMGTWLAVQLDIDASPAENWNRDLAPNLNFERFVTRRLLKELNGPLVWALDEVDRLFSVSFCSDVFGMFRSWFNDGRLKERGALSRLKLAFAYATESNLFISDLNQSPFNVGTKISLRDFNSQEIHELNARFGSPLSTADQIERFADFLNGHPYLSSRGLHTMATRHISLSELERTAAEDSGVFGDHLKRMVLLLAQDPELAEAVRNVLREVPVTSPAIYYRLCSGGVMTGDSPLEMRPRCRLYATYLRRHLL